MNSIRGLLCAAMLSAFSCAPCMAQTGTVTFYTPGNNAKSTAAGLLPRSRQPFTGWLFDGSQRLAHVQAGRVITLHLTPGAHSFTVHWSPKHAGKKSLALTIESDSHHCIKLYAIMTNFEVIPFQRVNSQMEEVPCEQAAAEAAHLKPIDLKRVDPSVQSEVDSGPAFPVDNSPHQ
jgi:hypothetical protein